MFLDKKRLTKDIRMLLATNRYQEHEKLLLRWFYDKTIEERNSGM